MQKWQVMFVFCASFGGRAMRSLILVLMTCLLEDVGLATVDQAVDADSADGVGFRVVAEQHARQVLGGLTTHHLPVVLGVEHREVAIALDRKSTRLNSSHHS